MPRFDFVHKCFFLAFYLHMSVACSVFSSDVQLKVCKDIAVSVGV